MSSELRSLDAGSAFGERVRRRAGVMWIAVSASLAALVILLGTGRGDNAWSIAAALLILSCVAVCTWTGFSIQQDIDDVVAEAKRLVVQRESRAAGHGRKGAEPFKRTEDR